MPKRGDLMADNKINERQEKFCQEIMLGKTQRQAYYAAYPHAQKWKPESVDNRAYVLAKSDEVLARLNKLRADAKKRNEITRDELISQLKSIGFAELDADNIKPTDKIKAIEVMAKMLGLDRNDDESIEETVGSVKNVLVTIRQAAEQKDKHDED